MGKSVVAVAANQTVDARRAAPKKSGPSTNAYWREELEEGRPLERDTAGA